MTAFPISNDKFMKWFRKANWNARFVDVNTLSKKMYMVLDGKLKAIKPIATAYALPSNATYSTEPRMYLVADVAGAEGKKIIQFTECYTKFYHSVEDFDGDRPFTLKGTELYKVLNNAGIETNAWSGTMYPIYYSWDHISLKVYSSKGSSIGLPVAVWSDAYGVHVDWSSTEDVCLPAHRYSIHQKMYRTKEDCRKDNQVQVVDFDDKHIGKKTTQRRIVINCDEGFIADTLREMATSYEDDMDNDKWYECQHGCGFIERIKED